jgi:hypothetical protein
VRKLLVLAAVCLAALAPAGQARAGQCGLPDTQPLWVDYDNSNFSAWQTFAKPGLIVGAGGPALASSLRSGGAQTIFFDLNFNNRMGTPTAPADPATIPDRVSKLFDFAASVSGCPTPLIAENELFGAGTTTPWSATNAQYRANVLTYLQGLAAKGARPFLLVSTRPYTGGDAGAWWQQVAQVADIVQEFFTSPKTISTKGPLLGSRNLRVAMRQAVKPYLDIGIPPSRVGLMLELLSGSGAGGRQGLQPPSAWFEVIKLESLAAREVASELALGSIWSWGWGTFAQPEDPDKPAAACVYLWTRSSSLCDGPAAAGSGFDASLEDGQLLLPAGVQCTFPDGQITVTQLNHLSALTGDPEAAASALLERLVERRRAKVSQAAIDVAERSLIRAHFRGSRVFYDAALTRAQASEASARAVLADQLRRARIEATLPAQTPSASDIRSFYGSYATTPARMVKASPAPWWLGGQTAGFALAPTAPAGVFTAPAGRPTTIGTADGVFTVQPVGLPRPLKSVPLTAARPAIEAALVRFAQNDGYQAWLAAEEARELAGATCLKDALPSVGLVDLSTYLTYLSLS